MQRVLFKESFMNVYRLGDPSPICFHRGFWSVDHIRTFVGSYLVKNHGSDVDLLLEQ